MFQNYEIKASVVCAKANKICAEMNASPFLILLYKIDYLWIIKLARILIIYYCLF